MQTQKSFIKMTMLHIEIVNEICLGIFFLRKGFTAQWRSGRGEGGAGRAAAKFSSANGKAVGNFFHIIDYSANREPKLGAAKFISNSGEIIKKASTACRISCSH